MRRAMVVTLVGMVGVGFALVSTASAGERTKSARKDRAVSFRLASESSQDGYEHMSVRGGDDFYVSSKALFTHEQVVSIHTVDARNGQALELTLAPEAANTLRNASADRLAIISKGRLMAAPRIETISADGVARVTDLSPEQVTRLSRMFRPRGAEPVGAFLQIVPREASGLGGDLFTVDVFIRSAKNLRTYQVALDVTGGSSGSLTREEAWIDVDRTDYIFGSAQAIKAVDEVGGRMGGVLFDGTVQVTGQVYVGTFAFRASDDAEGTFSVRARSNGDTFISGERHALQSLNMQAATITVGR